MHCNITTGKCNILMRYFRNRTFFIPKSTQSSDFTHNAIDILKFLQLSPPRGPLIVRDDSVGDLTYKLKMGTKRPFQPFGSVLVVGGCGFLGHHIVSQLLDVSSTKVLVLDLHTDRNRLPEVAYYDGDITSSEAVKSVLEKTKPEVIIHTASPTVTSSNATLYHKVNVDGTRTLLECAGQVSSTKAFIYTSSASVVHDNTSDLVMADESLPVLQSPEQKEIYSLTKGIADNLVLETNGKYSKMLTCSLRPAGIFGDGDVQMLPQMLKAYEEGKTKFQLGTNENLFDFTYVGNVAHAHLLAAQKLLEAHHLEWLGNERVDGEAFFITNDEPFYFWDFTHAVWAAAGDKTKPEEIWVIPKNIGLILAMVMEWIFWVVFLGAREPSLTRKKIKFSAMTRTYCIEKAKRRLGYEPITDMRAGIKKGVESYEMSRSEQKKTL